MISLAFFLQALSGTQDIGDSRIRATLTADAAEQSVVVGAAYRPSGDAAALQLTVAKQLETGLAAAALSTVVGRETKVQVSENGEIAVQLDLLSDVKRNPVSFMSAHAPELARSLATSDEVFYEQVEEISSPEAALMVKAAFVLTGNDEIAAFAGTAIILSRDPTVRAASAILAANGLALGRTLGAAADAKQRDLFHRYADATHALSAAIKERRPSSEEALHSAAVTAWTLSTNSATSVRAKVAERLSRSPAASAREKVPEAVNRSVTKARNLGEHAAKNLRNAAASESQRLLNRSNSAARTTVGGISRKAETLSDDARVRAERQLIEQRAAVRQRAGALQEQSRATAERARAQAAQATLRAQESARSQARAATERARLQAAHSARQAQEAAQNQARVAAERARVHAAQAAQRAQEAARHQSRAAGESVRGALGRLKSRIPPER